MPDTFSSYPYNMPVAFSFLVIFKDGGSIENDNNECMFQDVSGINASFDMEQVTEGGVNNYIHRLPKAAKYDNITFKRGLYRGSSLITWVNNALTNFTFKPMPVEINLLDGNAAKIVTWTLTNAYPVSLKIADLKSETNTVAIESLELAYSYFSRVDQK